MIAEKTSSVPIASDEWGRGMVSRLVLLGPPGAGKGTQATWLAGATGAVHISTGDLVREAITTGSALGQQFKYYSDRGELVPDTLIVDLVMPHLSAAARWILDGFPRDVEQAKVLDHALTQLQQQLERVIALTIDDERLVERLANRRLSLTTHRIYNLRFDPPPGDDPGPFVQRTDDHPDEIRRRLQVYHEKTEPLLAYYAERGTLCTIDASGPIELIHTRITAALTY